MPTLSPRAWICIGALVLIGVLVGIVKYQNGEIGTLNKENGAATVQVEAAKQTVELKEESGKVDDKHVTDFVKEDKQVKQQTDQRVKKTQEKVKEIEKASEALPATAENVEATDLAVSKTRVTALWDAYCATKTGAAGCPVPQPTQEKQSDYHSPKEELGATSA